MSRPPDCNTCTHAACASNRHRTPNQRCLHHPTQQTFVTMLELALTHSPRSAGTTVRLLVHAGLRVQETPAQGRGFTLVDVS